MIMERMIQFNFMMMTRKKNNRITIIIKGKQIIKATLKILSKTARKMFQS